MRLQYEAALFLPKSLKKAIALEKSAKKHPQNFVISKITATFALGNDRGLIRFWSDARVAEEARLESVYTPKGYPEFESRSLRREKH